MGNYHIIIMIHNPTMVAAAPKKRITPPVKKKIEAMLTDGASADVIAEELGLTVEQVEKYI